MPKVGLNSRLIIRDFLDTSSLFPLPRLRSILSADPSGESVTGALSRLHSLSVRSLHSLLALLLHSAHRETSVFARIRQLSLLVIDDLSTTILGAYPPGFEEDASRKKSGWKDHVNTDSVATKRTNVLKELGNKLALLAANRNIAVCHAVCPHLTSDLSTESAHHESGLSWQCPSGAGIGYVFALQFLMSGDTWTSICSFRVTLYRQRLQPTFCDQAKDVRFAYFQKCEGIVVKDEEAMNVPFLLTVPS